MNDTTKELLAKLEQVDQLLDQNHQLTEYYEHGAVREALDEVALIRAGRGKPPKAPSACVTMPLFPLEKKTYEPLEKELGTKKILFFGALGFTALMLIISFISHAPFFSTLSTIGVFGSIITGALFFSGKKKYAAKKKAYDDSVKLYEKTLGIFRDGLARFEQEKDAFMEELTIYSALHSVAYDEYQEALKTFHDKKAEAKAQFDANSEEIAQIDVISAEYFHLVKPIIANLKSGRADEYKEALNLAIDDERQAQEAAARRAPEARRAAEEARRTAIMEQQAAEERRHNQQMERQQAEQARAAEQQAKAAQQQAHKQAWEAKMQAEKERNEQLAVARRRCSGCANNGRCTANKNGLAGLTCGGFRPR